MLLFVPSSVFDGGGQYLYLYSKFGVQNANTDGPEVWLRGRVATPSSQPALPSNCKIRTRS